MSGAVSLTDISDGGLAIALEWPTARGTVLASLDQPDAAFPGDLVDVDPVDRHAAPMTRLY